MFSYELLRYALLAVNSFLRAEISHAGAYDCAVVSVVESPSGNIYGALVVLDFIAVAYWS